MIALKLENIDQNFSLPMKMRVKDLSPGFDQIIEAFF